MTERTVPAGAATDGAKVGGRVAGESDWLRLMPVVFVLLWSTGFIGAKFGLPYVEPLTFLLVRLAMVTVLLGVVSLVSRAPWPDSPAAAGRIAIAGLLVHGAYLSGVFIAINKGVPAGVTALVVGLQPLLTGALSGPLLGERVTGRQWAGLSLGLAGVALVVWEKISFDIANLEGLGFAAAALLGITFGTLYQKRHGGGMDLRTGTTIQYAATTAVLAVAAPLLETMEIRWTGELVFALAWLTLVLSVGAIFLLFLLIRRGAAAKVASLFYLTPPVTAVVAWAMFGEKLGWPAIIGMAVAASGVALVNRSR